MAWRAIEVGSDEVSAESAVSKPSPAKLLSLAAIHAGVAGWPEDWRELWDERVAIIIHDAGETLEVAEQRAFDCYRMDVERERNQ